MVVGATSISFAEVTEETKDAISVYPNPTKNTFNVKISLTDASETVTIKMFTSMGRQVVERNQSTGNAKEITTNVSLANLAAGVYYVKYSTRQVLWWVVLLW